MSAVEAPQAVETADVVSQGVDLGQQRHALQNEHALGEIERNSSDGALRREGAGAIRSVLTPQQLADIGSDPAESEWVKVLKDEKKIQVADIGSDPAESEWL